MPAGMNNVARGDGVRFTASDETSAQDANAIAHNGLPYGAGGLWVKVGNRRDDGGTDRAYIATSPDDPRAGSMTWTRQTGPVDVDLKAVAYSTPGVTGGKWVAVGHQSGSGQNVINSPDGETWTERAGTGGASPLYALAYNAAAARWMALGDVKALYSDDDGDTWSLATGVLVTVRGAVWSSKIGKAFAVADDGTLLATVDGAAWSATALGYGALYGVAERNGVLVIVGEAGLIATTRDGETWTQRASGTTADLVAVAMGPDQITVVGDTQIRGSLRLA